MADSRRVSKLPRALLAKMTDNNPQAIRAFENIETAVIETNPQEIADLIIRIDGVTDQAEQAVIIATQLTAIAQQLIADIRPTLNAVSVPLELSETMQAVNVSNDCHQTLTPIQVTI